MKIDFQTQLNIVEKDNWTFHYLIGVPCCIVSKFQDWISIDNPCFANIIHVHEIYEENNQKFAVYYDHKFRGMVKKEIEGFVEYYGLIVSSPLHKEF